MRVHPSGVSSSINKWQFPIAVGLLLLLLGVVMFRGPKERVVATQAAPSEKKVSVVVARSKIETGQALDKADVVLQERPISTLPADAISSLDALKSKVAAGPIPAGYPLALALLADPVVVLPVQESKVKDLIPESPIDTLLREIESETVALPTSFNAAAPARGARLAVTIANTRGESIVLAEDCWVASSNGRDAVLRVEPARALFMQSAKGFGAFGFIELPTDGPSPYAGKAVSGMEELKQRLEGKPVTDTSVAKKSDAPKMRGYAWVSGEGRRYGIDQNGEIKVVEGN